MRTGYRETQGTTRKATRGESKADPIKQDLAFSGWATAPRAKELDARRFGPSTPPSKNCWSKNYKGCVQISRGDSEAQGVARSRITLAWFKCITHWRRGRRKNCPRPKMAAPPGL